MASKSEQQSEQQKQHSMASSNRQRGVVARGIGMRPPIAKMLLLLLLAIVFPQLPPSHAIRGALFRTGRSVYPMGNGLLSSAGAEDDEPLLTHPALMINLRQVLDMYHRREQQLLQQVQQQQQQRAEEQAEEPMPLFPSSSSAFINAAATRLRPLVGAGDKLAAKRATFNGVNGNGGGIHRSKALAGALVEQSQLNQLQKMQQLQPARLSTFLAMVRKSHAE